MANGSYSPLLSDAFLPWRHHGVACSSKGGYIMEDAAFWMGLYEVRISMKILQYLLQISTHHPQHNGHAPAAWALLAVSDEPAYSLMMKVRSAPTAFEPRQARCPCMT